MCNSKGRGGGEFYCLCLSCVKISIRMYSLSVLHVHVHVHYIYMRNTCLSSCRLTLKTHTDDNDLSFQHFASDFIINGEVSLSYIQ